MRLLEMLERPEAESEVQEVVEDWREESGHMQICNPAPASGFLTPKVKLGQQVSRGTLLAEIDSETADQKHCVVSQQEGKVVVLREYPRINQGDTVAVIAENCEAL
jgi:predicted deacylase